MTASLCDSPKRKDHIHGHQNCIRIQYCWYNFSLRSLIRFLFLDDPKELRANVRKCHTQLHDFASLAALTCATSNTLFACLLSIHCSSVLGRNIHPFEGQNRENFTNNLWSLIDLSCHFGLTSCMQRNSKSFAFFPYASLEFHVCHPIRHRREFVSYPNFLQVSIAMIVNFVKSILYISRPKIMIDIKHYLIIEPDLLKSQANYDSVVYVISSIGKWRKDLEVAMCLICVILHSHIINIKYGGHSSAGHLILNHSWSIQ